MRCLSRFQALESISTRIGDLPDLPVRARQMRKFYSRYIVTDVSPGVPAGALGDPFEQQRQDRERHVSPDPLRREVIDGSQPQPALQPPPRFLHPLQLLVAERQVLGA